MASKEDFIKELEITTFSKPILREMGVKAILLVSFDIILGPIAYINKLTPERIDYLEFLEDLAHLGEFYTGISHGQIDKVTTRSGEEMIIGRTTRKVNETELIDIAVALIETTEYQEEILKMLKFAIRTAYGNPENFSNLLDKVLLEYQDIGKKKAVETPVGSYKDFAKSKIRNVGKIFQNWNGILFIDFEGDKINSSFLPDWIEAIKINPQDLAYKTRKMYQDGIIIPRSKQTFSMVSLKRKQVIVISTSNSRFVTLVFPTKEGMTKLTSIANNLDVLTDALSEVGLQFNEETMQKTLEIIDNKVLTNDPKIVMKEVLAVMVQANELMPKKTITQEKYETFEGELQKKNFPGFNKAFKEFDGSKTVFELSHKANTDLETMADFVVFCMTRGIVQVFARNGRR